MMTTPELLIQELLERALAHATVHISQEFHFPIDEEINLNELRKHLRLQAVPGYIPGVNSPGDMSETTLLVMLTIVVCPSWMESESGFALRATAHIEPDICDGIESAAGSL